MEGVAALGHVHNVLAMQNVVGGRSIHRFPYPQTLGVVDKAGGGAGLAHLLKLAAFLPGVSSGAAASRISNAILRNNRTIAVGLIPSYPVYGDIEMTVPVFKSIMVNVEVFSSLSMMA